MKIIELRVDNVKRIKAVNIKPDATLQVIGGRNAQGKSSVLDSIYLAFAGRKASDAVVRPIREGETHASVYVDLGDYVVERTWTQSGSKVTVTGAGDRKYTAPQTMLNELIGQLSFDPLAFTKLEPRKQRAALLDLLNLGDEIDELDGQRQLIFDERTLIGNRGRALGDIKVDQTLPMAEQSSAELIREIQAAHQLDRDQYNDVIMRDRARDRVKELERLLDEAREDSKQAERKVLNHETVPNVDELQQRLEGVEETNAQIRANNEAARRLQEQIALRNRYDEHTEKLNRIDHVKQQLLAEADFPVEGLSFTEDGLTYNGSPFGDASSKEQIIVSASMGMALNPDLRVMRIMDGSLLDDEAMVELQKLGAANDFQLWVERVGNGDAGAIVIEDGEVAP